jgi:hypothetical protein
MSCARVYDTTVSRSPSGSLASLSSDSAPAEIVNG